MLFYAVLLFYYQENQMQLVLMVNLQFITLGHTVTTWEPIIFMHLFQYVPWNRHLYPEIDICTQESAFVPRNRHLYPGIDICTKESAFVTRNRLLYPGIGAAFIPRMSALIVFGKFICVFYVQDLQIMI